MNKPTTVARNERAEKKELNRLTRQPHLHARGASITTRVTESLCALILCVSVATSAIAQQIVAAGPQPGSVSGSEIAAPDPQPGSIMGTVTDTNNDIVPGATVVLESPTPGEYRTAVAKDDGSFYFNALKPGIPYRITISANGFVHWTSPTIILNPGQFVFLKDSSIEIAGGTSSVTVYSSSAQIAVQQVKFEEQQRVLGFVPNFYVSYDPNAAPMPARLKFKLALRADTDPVTFLGVAFVAGLDQGGATPNYGGGAEGYGQRMGALYANGFADIMIGGAILPSLLHQDPRYFYQGTGTTRSRILHALSAPFICKGDNGRWQPNYSSVGGDLASGAISNAYYPESNRGAGLVFQNAAIITGGRMANGLVQEFLLRRLTPSARKQSY